MTTAEAKMNYYRQTYCSAILQKSDPDQRSGMDVFWHCDETMAVLRVLVRFGNGKVRRYDKGHRVDGFCTLAIVFDPETNRRFGQVAEISEQTFLEVWNQPEAAKEDHKSPLKQPRQGIPPQRFEISDA